MGNIYLFDVDGTLTAPKEKIDNTFAVIFREWVKGKKVYIVSGGSFSRIIGQLRTEIVDECSGVFSCMGNVFYRPKEPPELPGYSEWERVYQNNFKAPSDLYKELSSIVARSSYQVKTGNHYEHRAGMVNFSIVGRNATTEQRKDYAAYDTIHHEREAIVEHLKNKYDKLDFVIGGAVSIDIFNVGNDKAQVIDRHLEEALEKNKIIFVGDRTTFPGNDYSLATALRQHPNGHVVEVKCWNETAKLLKTEAFA